MSKKDPKIALAMIVKPTDEEAIALDRCLKHTAPHVDGIFITITGENDKVREVAKKYNADVSHFTWDYSFANARNFNFSQVSKDFDYILWADADDVFRGLEKMHDMVRNDPDVDVFAMQYHYWFDEHKNPIVVHWKSQLVRNDGCVQWMGAIHEDFKQNRELNVKMVKPIQRLHLSDENRATGAKERNLDIAKREVAKNSKDPRSWWNLANALSGSGQHDDALGAFETFIRTSLSDDEKYLAIVRMAGIYLDKRKFTEALDHARYAVGIFPDYPDAHYLMGHIYYEMNDFGRARDSYMMGLSMKPPQHKIIVYNPREYDYHPLMALAKTYFQLSLPSLALQCLKACLEIMPEDKGAKHLVKLMEEEEKKFEKATKELVKWKKMIDKGQKEKVWGLMEAAPDEVKSYPAICQFRNVHFVKEESSGKDLVIMCNMTGEEWNPETAREKGIGGSEEAVIYLSQGLAKKGWNVTVYNSCGYKEQKHGDVTYKPYWMWNHRDKQDVTIIWRHPKGLDYDINSKKVYLDLHDVLEEQELNKERIDKVDRIFVKSKAHRDIFPNVSDDKFAIVPNGVDVALFDKHTGMEQLRNPYYLVNFSSPDRALETILDILPRIIKRLPKEIAEKVHFVWFYGWHVFDVAYPSGEGATWKEEVLKKFEDLKKKGLVDGGGRLNHEQIAVENYRAGALIYPTNFYEIDFVGGTKAMLAGAIPITSDFAALPEKFGEFGVKVHTKATKDTWLDDVWFNYGFKDKYNQDKFIDAVVHYLKNVEEYEDMRKEMMQYARDKYEWSKIVDIWDTELNMPSKKLKSIPEFVHA